MPRAEFYKAALARQESIRLRSRCRRLERALKGLMKDTESLAKNSFTTFHRGRRVFNETIWEQSDLVSYRLWKAAKDALRKP